MKIDDVKQILSGIAMARPVSRNWKGYWQR